MIEVDITMLLTAGRQWREQADQLTGSVTVFKRATVSGLHPEVQGDMTNFLNSWGQAVGAVSQAAEEMDDKLTTATYSIKDADQTASEEFSNWLAS